MKRQVSNEACLFIFIINACFSSIEGVYFFSICLFLNSISYIAQ